MLYTPCSETEVYIALVMLDSDAVAKAVPIDKDAWKGWFPHLAPLIDRLGVEGRYDRFELIRLKRWSEGKVAVLGDAAHALPPNIGQGGGCAMMNALALAVPPRPREGCAEGTGRMGTRRTADHRPHPAGLGRARLASDLAAEAARARFVARRKIEVGGEAAHQDGDAPADRDVNSIVCVPDAVQRATLHC